MEGFHVGHGVSGVGHSVGVEASVGVNDGVSVIKKAGKAIGVSLAALGGGVGVGE